MNGLVKDFMKRNKVAVSYVRDGFGFKCGVVVALGKDVLGWAMVNHDLDSEYKSLKPHQLPAIQKFVSKGGLDVLNSRAYKKYSNVDGCVKVPIFNREVGLVIAINRALNNEIKIVETDDPMDDGNMVLALEGKVPKDKGMIQAIFRMVEKSRKIKWEV
jgi:hypothetical protein